MGGFLSIFRDLEREGAFGFAGSSIFSICGFAGFGTSAGVLGEASDRDEESEGDLMEDLMERFFISASTDGEWSSPFVLAPAVA